MIEQRQTVGGMVAENLIGGLGLAVLIVAVGAAFGLGLGVVLPWAAIGGAVVFGLFSTVRAFRDEVRTVVQWYAARRANDEVRHLRTIVEHMDALQAPQVVEGSPYELVDRALREHFLAGLPLSYEGMSRRGYSRQQWQTIHDVLVDVGVKDEAGHVLVDTLGEAQQILDGHARQGTVWPVGSDGRVRQRAYITG